MIRIRSLALAATFLAAAAASASAHDNGYSPSYGYGNGNGYGTRPVADETDVRQARQANRIEQGTRDGSLTGREAGLLHEQQRQIAEVERRAKADGIVDPNERANLRNMQNQASRSIEQERHDIERRNAVFGAPPYRPWWRSVW